LLAFIITTYSIETIIIGFFAVLLGFYFIDSFLK